MRYPGTTQLVLSQIEKSDGSNVIGSGRRSVHKNPEAGRMFSHISLVTKCEGCLSAELSPGTYEPSKGDIAGKRPLLLGRKGVDGLSVLHNFTRWSK